LLACQTNQVTTTTTTTMVPPLQVIMVALVVAWWIVVAVVVVVKIHLDLVVVVDVVLDAWCWWWLEVEGGVTQSLHVLRPLLPDVPCYSNTVDRSTYAETRVIHSLRSLSTMSHPHKNHYLHMVDPFYVACHSI
jgi:hypothetical protein